MTDPAPESIALLMQNTAVKQRIHLLAPSGLFLKRVRNPDKDNWGKFLQQSRKKDTFLDF